VRRQAGKVQWGTAIVTRSSRGLKGLRTPATNDAKGVLARRAPLHDQVDVARVVGVLGVLQRVGGKFLRLDFVDNLPFSPLAPVGGAEEVVEPLCALRTLVLVVAELLEQTISLIQLISRELLDLLPPTEEVRLSRLTELAAVHGRLGLLVLGASRLALAAELPAPLLAAQAVEVVLIPLLPPENVALRRAMVDIAPVLTIHGISP